MYYVLDRLGLLHGHYCAPTAHMDICDKNWRSGQPFDPKSHWQHRRPPAEPLQMQVQLKDDPFVIPEYAENPFPFVSHRVYAALCQAGVDNLITYETEMHLPNGEISRDYLAIQVIGLLSAADMQKSKYHADAYSATDEPAGEHEPVFFDKMVIDENKAHGILLFRLAQSPSTILVHESVKKRIESLGIDTLEFLDPGEVAG